MYRSLQEIGTSKSGKTKEFEIWCRGQVLGYIRWYPNWRKYCFYPLQNTVWDSGCLGEIRVLLDEINSNYEKEKQK